MMTRIYVWAFENVDDSYCKKVEENLPEGFSNEFDSYEEHLRILLEFLNLNFCSIHNLQFNEIDIIYFALYKSQSL